LLLLAPLAFAACGGSTHKSSAPSAQPPRHFDPVAYVHRAAHKTAKAPSEHVKMTGTGSASGVAVTINGSGDFDNRKRLGSMQATFSASGLSGRIDEVLSGTTLYMSSPLFAGSLPNGKSWMKLDLQKALASKGIDFSALMTQSPAQSLTRLEAAGTVKKLGTATIDGVATTHYRAHIDVSKVPQGQKIEALTHAKYGPTDIWIGNADGYVHRTSISYSYSVGGRSTSSSMKMDFSRFGEPVHVTVPPARETFDATNGAIQGLGG
jgi:hypothetical protein